MELKYTVRTFQLDKTTGSRLFSTADYANYRDARRAAAIPGARFYGAWKPQSVVAVAVQNCYASIYDCERGMAVATIERNY